MEYATAFACHKLHTLIVLLQFAVKNQAIHIATQIRRHVSAPVNTPLCNADQTLTEQQYAVMPMRFVILPPLVAKHVPAARFPATKDVAMTMMLAYSRVLRALFAICQISFALQAQQPAVILPLMLIATPTHLRAPASQKRELPVLPPTFYVVLILQAQPIAVTA